MLLRANLTSSFKNSLRFKCFTRYKIANYCIVVNKVHHRTTYEEARALIRASILGRRYHVTIPVALDVQQFSVGFIELCDPSRHLEIVAAPPPSNGRSGPSPGSESSLEPEPTAAASPDTDPVTKDLVATGPIVTVRPPKLNPAPDTDQSGPGRYNTRHLRSVQHHGRNSGRGSSTPYSKRGIS